MQPARRTEAIAHLDERGEDPSRFDVGFGMALRLAFVVETALIAVPAVLQTEAALIVSSLAVGAHGISAAYAGDAAHAPSVSPVIVQTVIAAHRSASAAGS